MFNPSNFKTPLPSKPVLGNSEHPVQKYVDGLTMRWFDSNRHVAYIGLKNIPADSHYANCKTLTYRPADKSIQFHELTVDELKALAAEGKGFDSPYEVITVYSTDKYVGNLILREIIE